MKFKALFLAAILAVMPCLAWAVDVTESDFAGTWNDENGSQYTFEKSYSSYELTKIGWGYTEIYFVEIIDDVCVFKVYEEGKAATSLAYFYKVTSFETNVLVLMPLFTAESSAYSSVNILSIDELDGEPVVLTRE